MGSKKVVKQKEMVYGTKKPTNIEDPEAYLKKRPVWAFKQCDLGHEKWIMNENSNTLIIYKERKNPVNMRFLVLLPCWHGVC